MVIDNDRLTVFYLSDKKKCGTRDAIHLFLIQVLESVVRYKMVSCVKDS